MQVSQREESSSRENYRSIMREAEDEIFYLGYDIGKT